MTPDVMKDRQVRVRMQQSLYDDLKALANQADLPVSALIRIAVRAYMTTPKGWK